MIRREKQNVVIQCDGCGQVRKDTKWRPYRAAWDEALTLGWRAKKTPDGKDYKHFCPECPEVV